MIATTINAPHQWTVDPPNPLLFPAFSQTIEHSPVGIVHSIWDTITQQKLSETQKMIVIWSELQNVTDMTDISV